MTSVLIIATQLSFPRPVAFRNYLTIVLALKNLVHYTINDRYLAIIFFVLFSPEGSSMTCLSIPAKGMQVLAFQAIGDNSLKGD